MGGPPGKHRGHRRSRRSLSGDLTIFLSVLMAIVLAILLVADYGLRSKTMRQEVDVQAERMANHLVGFLALPLWTYDQANLARICDSMVQSPLVNSIRITDNQGRLLHESSDHPLAPEDRIIKSQTLTYKGHDLGTAELELSLIPMRQQLWGGLKGTALIFASILLALTVALGWILRVLLRRPLASLERGMALVAQGDFEAGVGGYHYRELGGMAKSFAVMTEELKARQTALENQIAERKAAEERYALAVKGANDGIWDWDLTTDRIYFSPRWKEIIGYRPGEFPNDIEEWKKRIHPEDSERVVNAHQNYMVGITETLDLEYRLRHRDGSWRIVHTRGASLKDEYGEPVRIAGAISDITDRRTAQQALAESEEHYRAIVESFQGYLYICDDTFTVTFANKRLRERAEQEGLDPLGMKCHKLIQNLDSPCPWCRVDELFGSGVSRHYEFENPRDGHWYDVVDTPIRHPNGSMSKQCMIQDITERKLAEAALKESEERYRSLIETTSEGFIILDTHLRIQDTNEAMCQMLGMDRNDVLGRYVLDLLENEDREIVQTQTSQRSENPHRVYEFAFKRTTGEQINVLASATSIYDSEGRMTGSFAFLTNITDRKRMENQLRYQAMHDPLTGLPNRTLCLDRINRALERTRRREEYYYALIFVDLDRFKVINDSMGHNFGDRLLIEVGHRLLECVRELDTVSRFGGDEFIVLLEELGSPRKAIQVVKRMRQALRRPTTIDGHEVQLTASIGIVLGPTDFKKPEDILQYANIAMHRAKAKGRDRFKVFTARMLDHAIQLMTLENHMERALANGEFYLNYQPILNLSGGSKLYGFEVLARWKHPERGIIPPSEFIPVAEDTGMILDLGLWVLSQSARTMVEWMERMPRARDLVLSVNVSGRQFTQHDLAKRIRRILNQSGLPPEQLKLEITETAIMENAITAVDTLRQLKDLGVTLSVDDFGTGYSSMSYLQQLPLDNLKIDLSFVQMLDVAPENVEIVKAIINLAHTLNLEVVAEGVERVAHQRILDELGCDYCQGFLYARPMSVEEAGEFIANLDSWELPN